MLAIVIQMVVDLIGRIGPMTAALQRDPRPIPVTAFQTAAGLSNSSHQPAYFF
jgi:hypothetical protein